MNWNPPPGPRHWHLSSGIKDRGECAKCDLERDDFEAKWAALQGTETVTDIGHSPPPGSDSSA